MPIPDTIEFLTAEKAADYVGCTSTWIRRLLKDGRLPGKQVCGWTWLIDKSDLDQLKKNLTSRSVSHRDHPPKKAKRRAG